MTLLTLPAFVGDFYDTNHRHSLYGAGGVQGGLYELFDPDLGVDEGLTVNSELPIIAVITSPELSPNPGFKCGPRRVGILMDDAAEVATLRYFKDGSSTATKSREIGLGNWTEPWKLFAMGHQGSLGTTIQIEFEYQGQTAIEIEGYAIEIDQVQRHGGQPR